MDGNIFLNSLNLQDLIGQEVMGKGLYVGEYEIITPNGLKGVFDLYAAPPNLSKAEKKLDATYSDSAAFFRELKNWCDYDAEYFETEEILNAALITGYYNGGWFVPTERMLVDNFDKSAIKNQFIDKPEKIFARWVWSCTRDKRDHSYLKSLILQVVMLFHRLVMFVQD